MCSSQPDGRRGRQARRPTHADCERNPTRRCPARGARPRPGGRGGRQEATYLAGPGCTLGAPGSVAAVTAHTWPGWRRDVDVHCNYGRRMGVSTASQRLMATRTRTSHHKATGTGGDDASHTTTLRQTDSDGSRRPKNHKPGLIPRQPAILQIAGPTKGNPAPTGPTPTPSRARAGTPPDAFSGQTTCTRALVTLPQPPENGDGRQHSKTGKPRERSLRNIKNKNLPRQIHSWKLRRNAASPASSRKFQVFLF